jgi:hypothetical protein
VYDNHLAESSSEPHSHVECNQSTRTHRPTEETGHDAVWCIDLHPNNSLMALLDDHDKIVFKKQVSNETATIFTHLVPYHARLVGLVVESASNWYGLVDGLLAAGSDAAVQAKPMGRLSCPGVDHRSSLDLGTV